MKFIDLTGKIFGQLTVIEKVIVEHKPLDSSARWLCKCECGTTKIVRASSLTQGDTKSCGHKKEYNTYVFKGDTGYCTVNSGKTFIFSKNDYNIIKNYTWYIRNGYPVSNMGDKHVTLHILILGELENFVVDHIDRNKLNNTRSNLRHATVSLNIANSVRYENKVGHRGIILNHGSYYAVIKHQNIRYNLGRFKKLEDAITARKAAELKYFGEYCPEATSQDLV